MSLDKFIKINKTPVKTKSWVGVNDITLEKYKGLEIKEFSNAKISNLNDSIVRKIEGGNLKRKIKYGIGEEITEEADNRFNQGYIIELIKDSNIEKAIVIEYEFDENNNSLVDNLSIIAEEGSKGTIIINYKSADSTEAYHNGLWRIVAKKNSELQIIKVNLLNGNSGHFHTIEAEIGENAKVNYIAIDFGGKYNITNYHGDLTGNEGSASIESIYLGDGDKIIDINYIMSHKGKKTKSKITTNGVLKDTSKKTFKGTIDFKRGASKSIGAESEYCMLLSKDARSKAMPLLLCEEEDVSGEHAASSGNIDENKLFYLMSRGLSYKEAMKVVVQGTFNPVIDKIPVYKFKEYILKELDRRLINE